MSSSKVGMEKQVGFSRRMEDLDGCCFDSSNKPPRVEFDSSEPLSLNSTRHKLDQAGPLSLNSPRHEFDSLGFNSTRHEPLSLNSMRLNEFDSVEPLSLEYEYEIEGLGRPQQQEHCSR